MDWVKVWYSFHTVKIGTGDEWIELPIRAETPEGAAAVLQCLLRNRPNEVTNYRVEVRAER